jgi:hypothetical protein
MHFRRGNCDAGKNCIFLHNQPKRSDSQGSGKGKGKSKGKGKNAGKTKGKKGAAAEEAAEEEPVLSKRAKARAKKNGE